MPKIRYIQKKFSKPVLEIINSAENIINEYEAEGYDLTVRQLYYQFVARDIIPNNMNSYKRLASIINDARLAGLIDWDAIVDRTRQVRRNSHWNSPSEILEICADQFAVDKWENQPYHIEVWIEKDALVGVIENVCREHDIPYFSCRGYTSQSEVWSAAQRLQRCFDNGQEVIILHLGDHDPSGIDMTRDIQDRLDMFMEHSPMVNRIALNQKQVQRFNPPANPAKITDSRASKYISLYGNSSWELDALEPKYLVELIEQNIRKYKDKDSWNEKIHEEKDGRRVLKNLIKKL